MRIRRQSVPGRRDRKCKVPGSESCGLWQKRNPEGLGCGPMLEKVGENAGRLQGLSEHGEGFESYLNYRWKVLECFQQGTTIIFLCDLCH